MEDQENKLNPYDGGNGINNNRNTPPGGGNNPNGNKGNGQAPKKQSLVLLLVAALISLLCMSYFMRIISGGVNEVTYNEFLQMVEDGKVKSVELASDRINITMKEDADTAQNSSPLQMKQQTVTYYTGNVADDTLVHYLIENKVDVKGEVQDNSGLLLSILLTYVLPIALVWVVLSLLFKKMSSGGGPMGVGKSNAKVYVQKETGITFKDVAGEDEAKESLQEVVDFLHNPSKYAKIGAKLPKGALLVGPPGTG